MTRPWEHGKGLAWPFSVTAGLPHAHPALPEATQTNADVVSLTDQRVFRKGPQGAQPHQ